MARPARAAPTKLEGWPEMLTLKQAVEASRFSNRTLRQAIYDGKLKAIIPRGVDPRRVGAGQGYRIKLSWLEAWLFNTPLPPEDE